MSPMLLSIFQTQVAAQCLFLIRSYETTMQALADLDRPRAQPGVDREAMNRLWHSLQNLLVAAANISKALWGQSGKYHDERRPLRRSIQVTNASPLRITKMRNHFEHFDERLDQWEKESVNHIFVDSNLGPLTGFISPSPAKIDVFRHFDPTTGRLSFWGDEFDVPAIAREAARILPIAEAEARKWPFPH